jgi:hypothetical protein
MEPQSCVTCRQPLPGNSKLTLVSVSREEAERNGWSGAENPNGTVIVGMCLQSDRPVREQNQPRAQCRFDAQLRIQIIRIELAALMNVPNLESWPNLRQ